jgi:hypothetical protein
MMIRAVGQTIVAVSRRLIACTMMVLSVLHSASAQAADPRAVALVHAADERYRAHDYGAATQLLNDAQQVSPDWAEITFNAAVIAEARGEFARAATAYRNYAGTLSAANAQAVLVHSVELERHQRALDESRAAPKHSGGLPWWGWVLIAVGAVAVVGAVSQSLSHSDESDPYGSSGS